MKKKPKNVSCDELPSNGSNFVAPENIVENEWNTITLNPAHNQYYEKGSFERFNLWTAYVYTYLKQNLNYCDLELFPEISSKGRLHLHGYIKIKLVAEFYLHDVAKLVQFGNVEVDTVKDMQVWDTYVRKQVKVLKSFTETNKHYNNNGMMSVTTAI